MGDTRQEYVSVGKPQNKKLFRINFTEISWEGMDWADMAHDRNNSWALVNSVMNLQITLNV